MQKYINYFQMCIVIGKVFYDKINDHKKTFDYSKKTDLQDINSRIKMKNKYNIQTIEDIQDMLKGFFNGIIKKMIFS